MLLSFNIHFLQMNRLKAMNEDLTKQVLELQDEVPDFPAPPLSVLILAVGALIRDYT